MKREFICSKLSKFILMCHLLLATAVLQAQVTIGSDIPPTRAALLELKAKQTGGTVPSVTDDANITAGLGDGGLLLPRVKLVSISTLEPFIPANDAEFVNNTNSLKEKLAGLTVYNITNNGPGSTLYPALYTWNGVIWVTSQANEAIASVLKQPKAFTFYEKGTETVEPLVFKVDGLGTWTYQWYQVTGNNVHVRIGQPITQGVGYTTAEYKPTQILKGTTRNANNTGFYKYYCIAKSSLGSVLESDIAEVAVGCGAKNNQGEWISFMCFNLGADNNSTIQSQKDYPIGSYTNTEVGMHTYIEGEETLFGDLFQWGRIADGHEKRKSGAVRFNTLTVNDITDGNYCAISGAPSPSQQIGRTSPAYGKFIEFTNNWNPGTVSNVLDQLWRAGRYTVNDPCARYKVDGSYQEWWHDGTDHVADSPACIDSGTSWRTAAAEEWGSIYKGGVISGGPATSTANTWVWLGKISNTVIEGVRGYEIKPDGVTTTLFLPTSGARSTNGNGLYYQGASAIYWTTTIINANAYTLSFTAGNINPVNTTTRATGAALRCVKNN